MSIQEFQTQKARQQRELQAKRVTASLHGHRAQPAAVPASLKEIMEREARMKVHEVSHPSVFGNWQESRHQRASL